MCIYNTMTRMRKRARRFPIITTSKTSYYSSFFSKHVGENAFHLTGTKKYNNLQDEIVFGSCERLDEDTILNLLYHEIEHWAHDIYLADCEVNKRIEAYNKEMADGRTPFTEWISGGKYDMSEWEKKYKHRGKDNL
jgi:hypothetical protein